MSMQPPSNHSSVASRDREPMPRGASRNGSPLHHIVAYATIAFKQRVRSPLGLAAEILMVPLFTLSIVIGYLIAPQPPIDDFTAINATALAHHAPLHASTNASYPELQIATALCVDQLNATANRAPLPLTSSSALSEIPRCSLPPVGQARVCFGTAAWLGGRNLCAVDHSTSSTTAVDAASAAAERGDVMGELLSASSFMSFEALRAVPDLDTMTVVRAVALAGLSNSQRSYRTPIAALGNGVRIHRIHAPPYSDLVHAWLQNASSTYADAAGFEFTSDVSFRDYSEKEENFMTSWCAYDLTGSTRQKLSLTLLCNSSGLPRTDPEKMRAFGAGLASHDSRLYLASGFLTLQAAVTEAFTNIMANRTTSSNDQQDALRDSNRIAYAPMPVPGGRASPFILLIAEIFAPLFLGFGFMFTVSQTVRRVVVEKENGLREAILIGGLSTPAIFAGWFFAELPAVLVSALITSGMLKLSLMNNSHYGVIYGLFALVGIVVMCFSGFLASLFSRARLAAMIAPVLFFVLVIPAIAAPSDPEAGVIYGFSVSPVMSLRNGAKLILTREASGGGFSASDIDSERDAVNMETTFIILGSCSAIWLVLMAYVDAVIPRPLGRRKSCFFCLTAPLVALGNLLCGSREEKEKEELHSAGLLGDGRDLQGVFERRDDSDSGECGTRAAAGVELTGLTRDFTDSNGDEFRALDRLTLRARPGEITALLGPNGAGKSTTYSILTGSLAASDGRCALSGLSVRHDADAVRQHLAYCPQHNLLWADLSPREHLQFVATSRGFGLFSCGTDVSERVNELLRDFDLTEKADSMAAGLSGGQKRKLAIAMAFMADAHVTVLDEPTAGCDVSARFRIWSGIRKYAGAPEEGRIVLLSTHFLEEADALADYVAILCRGRLKAAGSPTFLKGRLGVGSCVTVTIAQNHDGWPQLRDQIHAASPSSSLAWSHGELVITVPREVKHELPSLLDLLEKEQPTSADDLQRRTVLGFGVSETTMETIFLNLVESDAKQAEAERRAAAADGAVVSTTGDDGDVPSDHAAVEMETIEPAAPRVETSPQNDADDGFEGLPPLWTPEDTADGSHALAQLFPLLRKRFIYARRDVRTLCLQTLVPVVAITLAMLFGLISPDEGVYVRFRGDSYRGHPTEAVVANCSALLLSPSARVADVHDGVVTLAVTQGIAALANSSSVVFPDGIGNSTVAATLPPAARLQDFLLAAFDHHERDRVTSYSCSDPTLRLVAGDVISVGTNGGAVLFGNESFIHSSPQSLQELQGLRLRAQQNDSALEMSIGSWPLKYTPLERAFSATIFAVVIALMSTIAFSVIPSTFISFVAREREEGSKQLQLASGVSLPLYWISHLIFDLFTFCVTTACIFCVYLAFSRNEYVGTSDNFEATLLLFVLFGLASAGMAYCLSFAFDSHASAQNVVLLTSFIVGFLLTALIFMLEPLSPQARETATILRYVFRVVPIFALADGLVALSALERDRVIQSGGRSSSEAGSSVSPWRMDTVGWNSIYMGTEVVLFAVLLGLIERGVRCACLCMRGDDDDNDKSTPAAAGVSAPPPDDEDPDVAAERERVNDQKKTEGDVVVMHNMRKEFGGNIATGSPPVVAVHGLSLGIQRASVFGFLGANGAGKTTTLNIVTAREGCTPSCGSVRVDGIDPVTDPRSVHSRIGVCPQFDIVFSLLTPDENLRLVASLRGVPIAHRDAAVDRLIAAVGLEDHRYKTSATLSGGNRRKLSVAVALVGAPPVVVLDEPTAGVDTLARRSLWDVMARAAQQATVILTTHHLAEVEHLADRVGIMVDGHLRCLGSLQHLKGRYGAGYTLRVRVATSRKGAADDAAPLLRIPDSEEDATNGDGGAELLHGPEEVAVLHFVQLLVPSARVLSSRAGTVTFGLPPPACGRISSGDGESLAEPAGEAVVHLSSLVAALQQATANDSADISVPIADYALSQTSVDDVFLSTVEQTSSGP